MALDATTLEPRATVDLLGANGPATGGYYSAFLLTPPPPLSHSRTQSTAGGSC